MLSFILLGVSLVLVGMWVQRSRLDAERRIVDWYPGAEFLHWFDRSRISLSYDSDISRSKFQLTALHRFPLGDADAKVTHCLRKLEGLLTPTYESGQAEHENYRTGWSRDSLGSAEAMKSASHTAVDFTQPRLSAGYFMSDHNEGGRCAVIVDSTNSWMLFHSSFDD